MRVGYILGDFRNTRWSTLPSVIEKFANDDLIEPVAIYTHGDLRRLPSKIETVKLEDYPLPPHWHRLERNHQIDLFHLSSIPKWGQIPTIFSDVPVVATARGTAHWCNNIPSDSVGANTIYKADFCIRDLIGRYTLDSVFTVSDYVAQTLFSEAGYRPGQLYTTYLGIEDIYYEAENITNGVHVQGEYVLSVSNQTPIKNLRTVVDGIELLADDCPGLSLVVAGRGWADELQELCEKKGIEDRVVFLGYVGDVETLVSLYDGAEACVVSSLHETFGRPAIEAMARGTPVISTRNCALDEITGGLAEYVDNPYNPHEFADRIQYLVNNASVRAELGSHSKEYAQRFTFSKYINRLKSSYMDILETNSTAEGQS